MLEAALRGTSPNDVSSFFKEEMQQNDSRLFG
jgi:hypothetical protein